MPPINVRVIEGVFELLGPPSRATPWWHTSSFAARERLPGSLV